MRREEEEGGGRINFEHRKFRQRWSWLRRERTRKREDYRLSFSGGKDKESVEKQEMM